LKFCCY